jgi:hypothetical protein
MVTDLGHGHGEKTYRLEKYHITVTDGVLEYVVYGDELSPSELVILSQHCQCRYCTTHILNPSWLLMCRTCEGCLKSTPDNQSVIYKTRKYMEKMQSS